MVKVTINGFELEVDPGTSILNACEKLALEVPTFCYHPRLKVAGNCRMCLVEVEKSPKPIASCSTPVSEGMVIHTDSPMVENARKGVLELLLINHPLDCPICDQGGECDLQDITFNYGSGNSNYNFYKRAVSNKNLGPFIKTEMNRCIHCMRCVRFMNDIAGMPEIGSQGRGENTEIFSYLNKTITSELSGNIIDLCPVGALTNKPYAFQSRSWELKHTNSIDITDALGSAIRLDSKNEKILRIMPRLNESINEEWISDKVRFFYDGLSCQRLDTPYIKINGKFQSSTWNDAFLEIKNNISSLNSSEIAAISGDTADQESQFALVSLFNLMGVNNLDCRPYGTEIPYADRSQYIFNSSICGIEKSDVILIIGSNPRFEATILNTRIKKAVTNGASVGLISNNVELTYNFEFLSDNPTVLQEIINENNNFSKLLKNAKKPTIILGMDCFTRKDTKAILYYVNILNQKYGCEINTLHTSASCVGGLDVGFYPKSFGKNTFEIVNAAQTGEVKFLYLLNADIKADFKNSFVVYQGHHGDFGAHQANVILPGLAFSEKSSTFVNTEGVSQVTNKAVTFSGNAKEDWKIIKALSLVLEKDLPFNTLDQLRSLLPTYSKEIEFVPFTTSTSELSNNKFKPFIENYYMHDVISRNSKNMASAVREILKGNTGHV